MRRLLLLVAALMLAGAASAQVPTAEPTAPFPPLPASVDWARYPRAREVQLRDIAAIVYITPETRPDVAVAVVHRGGAPGVQLSAHGRRLRVDGRNGAAPQCRVEEGGAFAAHVDGAWLGAERLPIVYLRVPREAVIAAAGAMQIHMRRAESVRLRLQGCGDADLEGAEGSADISVTGDRPRVRLYDAGAAAIRIAGDGEVLLGVARESLAVSIAGDGDVLAAHVDGATNVAITGEGQVVVREGRARPMSVTILGEGRVIHNGAADRLDVAILGDGDVRVRQVDGAVNRRVFGDGRVVVGEP